MNTIEDISLKKLYRDELLNFIHSEIGLSNISKKKILKLIKEHKKISKGIYKDCTIQSFNASFNGKNEPLNGLKKLVDVWFFNYSDVTIRDMFGLIAVNKLGVKCFDVCLYINLNVNNWHNNSKRIKVKLNNNKRLKMDYIEFLESYIII